MRGGKTRVDVMSGVLDDMLWRRVVRWSWCDDGEKEETCERSKMQEAMDLVDAAGRVITKRRALLIALSTLAF